VRSSTEPLDQRLQLVISKGQIRAIDEWRRQQPDLPSRSEAIRRLIARSLVLDTGQTPSRSVDPANERGSG
jgi:hypothetical protein